MELKETRIKVLSAENCCHLLMTYRTKDFLTIHAPKPEWSPTNGNSVSKSIDWSVGGDFILIDPLNITEEKERTALQRWKSRVKSDFLSH